MWNYIHELLQMSKGVRRFIVSESILGIAIGIYILVYNLHLLEIGFNEARIGEITSLGTLVMGILSIPSALLAGRFGRKNLLVLGIVLLGVGYAGIGLGEKIQTFYIAQIITSIGITLLVTSEIQLLFHYSRSKKEETQAFSMLFAIFTLFTGVGTLLGGYIPQWLGGKTTVYQSSLLIASGLIFLVAIIRGIMLPKETHSKAENTKNYSFKQLKEQFFNRQIWITTIFIFLIAISFAFVIPFLNIIIKFRLNWSDVWVSIFLTVNGFFLFIGSIIMPYVIERYGIAKTYFFVFVANIALSVLLFINIQVAIFSFVLLIRGGTFTMLNNLVESQTMQAIEEKDRNFYAGLKSVSRSLGSAIATYIAGIILASKNYTLPFLLSGIILIFGYIYFLIWVRPLLEKKLVEKESA